MPCEPLLRIPASEPALRVEPLREAALRAAPQRSTAARFRRGALHGGRRHGNVRPRCALGSSATAGCSRNAFPGAWLWQVFAVVRSRAAIRGNFLASCIPEGAPDGKSAPPWQHIAAMHPKRAGFGKIRAPCIRKAPQIAFRECIARISCRGGALFAALTPRITHGARILPSHRRRRTARATQLLRLRHPHYHRLAGSPRCLCLIDRLLSLSAVPRSHPLQLRLPWRSTFPTRGASLRLYFALSAAAIGI